MSDPTRWQEDGGHPEASLLLFHLEGETEGARAAAVAAHVKDCWVCRAECQRLNQGMNAFVEHWELVVQQTPVPSPPSGLPIRLRELAAAGRRSRLLPASPRIAWFWGAASAALLGAFWLLSMVLPSTVSAEELLARAQSSQSAIESRPAVHRRLQIRQGSRLLVRDLYTGTATDAAAQAETDPQIESSLAAANIDSRDPLNARRFALWRGAQARRRDVVTESGGLYTLTTAALGPGPIEAVSFTVRGADWRPVDERVEFRDRLALEVREVLYEGLPARPAGEPPAAIGAAKLANPPENRATAAAYSLPTERSGDQAEVELREALHSVQSDLREAPQISRTAGGLRVEAFVETAQRKSEILEAIRGIPGVDAHIAAAGDALPPSRVSEVPGPARLYRSTPPLATNLWTYFGGLDQANDYLTRERDAYLQFLLDASALNRLAARYPDSEWARLPQPSREALERIAADYRAGIQSHAAEYLGLVSPVLDEMVHQSDAVPPRNPQANSPGCSGWRSQALPLLQALQSLQVSFRKLFVIEETDEPVDLSVESLLRHAAEARAGIQEQLNRICPF